MYSLKLWHFLVTSSVVVALISLAVHHLLIKESKWQSVSTVSLEQKVNHGLKQIYWQWQNEGRPEQIVYQPEHANRAIAIRLGEDGKPDFEINPDSCRAFLNWFVDGVSVNQFLEVDAHHTPKSCAYTLSNRSFAYHVDTAETSR